MMEKLLNEFEQKKTYLKENLQEIRERIAEAAVQSGRQPQDITLLAATKTVPAELINYAISLGITHIGENRVQELLEKYDALDKEHSCVQLIGHLQTNKVRKVIGLVSMIQSVDSVKLAQEISRVSLEQGVATDVLIEINIGGEENKSGVIKDAAFDLIEEIAAFQGIKVRGLMAIPPICEKTSEIRGYFSDMRKLFIDMAGKKIDNVTMDYLSMGMSGDYYEAVLEGANMVRIGSSLFGARNYNKT